MNELFRIVICFVTGIQPAPAFYRTRLSSIATNIHFVTNNNFLPVY